MNCTVDGCTLEAQYAFTWPWGTPDFCCPRHVVVVQQQSKTTRGRFGAVAFAPLNPDRVREVTHDERVQLIAKRVAAEQERDDAHIRSTKLHEANKKLSDDVRAHKLRCEQLQAEVKRLLDQIDALITERDAALVLASKAREEAERFGVELDPKYPHPDDDKLLGEHPATLPPGPELE